MDPKRLAAAMEAAGVGSQGTSPAGSALEGKFEPKDPGVPLERLPRGLCATPPCI